MKSYATTTPELHHLYGGEADDDGDDDMERKARERSAVALEKDHIDQKS